MFRKLDEKTQVIPHTKQIGVPDQEWIELVSDIVMDKEGFWSNQTFRKDTPGGILEIIFSLADYRGLNQPVAKMPGKEKNQSLCGNVGLLRQKLLLILKSRSKKQTTDYGKLEDAGPVAFYSKMGRSKLTEQFYDALERMLTGNAVMQCVAKNELLKMRDKVWVHVLAVKLDPEEAALFYQFSNFLDAFAAHVKTRQNMAEHTLPLMKHDKTILTLSCKLKFNTLKPKMQALKEQLLLVDKTQHMLYFDSSQGWFKLLNTVFMCCAGHVAEDAKIDKEDLERLNQVPKSINSNPLIRIHELLSHANVAFGADDKATMMPGKTKLL
jgi:hypothetical protein